jgi:ankyrin repeat protein
MALFCACYLTSLPFAPGLCGSEVMKHAITGYYGFQDYAAAFWWKHAYRVINTATDISTDLYNRTMEAVARAMEAYGNSNNSVPKSGGCSFDAVQRRLREVAKDAHEWENNFKIEFRTQAIRGIIEILLSEEGALEAHCSFLTLYGAVRYKCPKPWCQSFYAGFDRRKDRDQHILEHNRPFRCSVEGCYGNEIGFPSESDLSRHNERLHSTQPIYFASPRPSKSEPQVICSAAAMGDLAKVEACLLAGIPIDTTRTNMGSETPLYLAAKKGHIHICQYLLERGADMNFQGGRGPKRTPLHAAAMGDDEDLTHLLLSQLEAAPQLKDRDHFTAAGCAAKNGSNKALSVFITKGLASQPGQDITRSTCLSIALYSGKLKTAELLINDTSLDLNKDYGSEGEPKLPLHIAARTGLVQIVQLLLFSGRVDINKTDLSGRLALHHACESGHDSIVELLLPVSNDHDARNDNGATPLSYAAEKGHEVIVKLLPESGKVNINSKDNFDFTPLSYAAENGYIAIVKLLLESSKVNVDLEDQHGQSWLSLAAAREDKTFVKLLLESGKVDADSKDQYGRTWLSYAAMRGDEAFVKLLLKSGKVDVNLKDNSKRTPLLYATEKGYVTIVKLLLENSKVDANSTDNSNRTPLFYAAVKGNEAIVRLLLESGKVDTNLKDNSGWIPLLYAIKKGHIAVIDLFLKNSKVNADSRDYSDRTPLLYAAVRGDEAVVKLLLDIGKVNADSRDKHGRTPLSYAAERGHAAIVKLLLEDGKADAYSRDNYSRTPLSYAAVRGDETVVRLLRSGRGEFP